MKNELHIYHHFPDGPPDPFGLRRVLAKLDEIKGIVSETQVKETTIMATLDTILSKVQEERTVEDGVVTLLQQLFALTQGSGDAQAKLDAIEAAIQGNEDNLAAAVVANTPAPPAA